MRPSISIIGAGKVGTSLAVLLHRAGYKISATVSRSPESAIQLAQEVGARFLPKSELKEIANLCDLVLITVPDDVIEDIANDIARFGWQGKAVIHTSGAKSIEALKPVEEAGAMVGSFHPVFPFSNRSITNREIVGSTFALESNDMQLRLWLEEMVEVLDGKLIYIPRGKKSLYHTALVMASNYLVTLYSVSEQILINLGAEPDSASAALTVLVSATISNIDEQGIPDALTGPLSRGDVGTLREHLAAIEDVTLAQVYRGLARLSYPMLEKRGVDTALIEQVLQETS